MATTPTVISEDISMSDLRALTGTPAPAQLPGPKTETSETTTEEKPVVETTEAASEPADQTTESTKTDETEEPLPAGVQKRIKQEAERAARVQAEIDRAISARKAKEAELAKLTTEGEKGSEPVKPPQATSTNARPQPGEKGHENETWEQYEARRDEWIRDQAVRDFEQRQAEREAQKQAQDRWDAAVKEHGADFPALIETARQNAPEGLQVAISGLDNWSHVAVHLAKNPAELQELAALYQQNSTKAIAKLGRIEAALMSKTVETKPATQEKPLPKPLAKAGGSASASGESLQDVLEKGSMSQIRARLSKMRPK